MLNLANLQFQALVRQKNIRISCNLEILTGTSVDLIRLFLNRAEFLFKFPDTLANEIDHLAVDGPVLVPRDEFQLAVQLGLYLNAKVLVVLIPHDIPHNILI